MTAKYKMKGHSLPPVSHQQFSNWFDSFRLTVCSKLIYQGTRHSAWKKTIRGISTVDTIVFTKPGP